MELRPVWLQSHCLFSMTSHFALVYLEGKCLSVLPEGAGKLPWPVPDSWAPTLTGWIIVQGTVTLSLDPDQSMTNTELLPSKWDQRANNEKSQEGEECHKAHFTPSQWYLPVKKGHLFLRSMLLKAVSTRWTDDGSQSSCAKADGRQCCVKQPLLLLFWYMVNHMVSAYIEISQGKSNHR